uniref:Uncharacterized protein n=1 Tax=Glossina austeni TaxID=7395 RepID=A0A1A9VGD7_GLOAU
MEQNTEKAKVKCKRALQPVRWADAATEQLLQLIAHEIKKHPSSFDVQKLIAQQYCDKFSAKCVPSHKPSCCCQKSRSRYYKIHQMNSRKPRNETASDSSSKVFSCYEILNKTAGVNLKSDDLVFYINPITNEILDEETVKAYRPTPEAGSETRNDGGGTSNGSDFMFSKDEKQSTNETSREVYPKPSLSFSASVPNLHMSTMSLGTTILKKKLSFQWTESITDHFLNLIMEEIEKHPDYLNEKCPYYDNLDKIFGPSLEDEIHAYKYCVPLNNNTSEDEFKKTELSSSDGSDIFNNANRLNEDDSDAKINRAPSLPNMSQSESEYPQQQQQQQQQQLQGHPMSPKLFLDASFSYPSSTPSKHSASRQSMSKKSSSQMTIEKRKIEVEHEKLQLEQKKFNWQLEKEGTELRLKQKELEHQFELRKFELAKSERMENAKLKLQMEHEEKMKKYEMKMKHQNLSGL